MTRFLSTKDGGLVNIDAVESVDEVEGAKGNFLRARLRGRNDPVTLDAGDLFDVGRMGLPVVAAAPGYLVLWHYMDDSDGESFVDRLPVVAWRINGDEAFPVTPEQDRSVLRALGSGDAGILYPDGRVLHPSLGEIFDDEKAWRARLDHHRRKPKNEDA